MYQLEKLDTPAAVLEIGAEGSCVGGAFAVGAGEVRRALALGKPQRWTFSLVFFSSLYFSSFINA